MATLTPRTTRRTRAKHGGRKETVEERLLAAMERLLERGLKFGSLTVEQLATEAGMSRGTFYLHFKDKGELVARLMGVVTEEIVQSAGAWLAYADKPQRKDIEAALWGVSGAFKKHRTIIAALNDTASSDPAVEALYMEMMQTICTRCRHSVAAARRDGVARPGANDAVADALSWIVVLYFGRFAAVREGDEFERLTKAVTHICATAVFLDPGEVPAEPAQAPTAKPISARRRS
ncbi:TetR/AcrR family transcriptional regulator [Hydrocarboniphaga sp.]|uniref:TetR/AcrR family transcriptional regulator n=1 Tax=Hydrocarboniphaga sp. TaxID=2033016 RepID=UPI003D09E08B